MKAVIETGGKQYVVSKGDELAIELLDDAKTVSFDALMIIDDKKTAVGTPTVPSAKVTAKVVDQDKAGDKVAIMKFKSKKRQKTLTGHRQHHTIVTITDIKAA